MNNYLKSFLKLADEVLCESYTINNPDNSSKQTLEDIKRVLKYRFGLDFDKDIRYIVSSDFKSRKDKDSYLPRILRKMTKFHDQKISYRFISDATLDIPLIKTCITQDDAFC